MCTIEDIVAEWLGRLPRKFKSRSDHRGDGVYSGYSKFNLQIADWSASPTMGYLIFFNFFCFYSLIPNMYL